MHVAQDERVSGASSEDARIESQVLRVPPTHASCAQMRELALAAGATQLGEHPGAHFLLDEEQLARFLDLASRPRELPPLPVLPPLPY
jgi:hypothetical protein